MCRFLLVRSKNKLTPKPLLHLFAATCEKSRTPDGDRQADGWGVAWADQGKWQIKKSLAPIWQDSVTFSDIPQTNVLAVHARSASFSEQKGVLEYNQPFIEGNLCFVFNGWIKGIRLPYPVSGAIGAQKIFTLVREQLDQGVSVEEALHQVKNLLSKHARIVGGLNIGIIKDNRLISLCQYGEQPNYFSLWNARNDQVFLICSEPIGNYKWQKLGKGKTISY